MLLVLVVVWGLVLFSWIRTRFRTDFGDPVSTFHRNLSVLEHAGPRAGRPPGRLTVPPGFTYPAAPPRPLPAGLALPRPSRRSAAALARRRQKLRRRRDVLLALVSGAVVSLLFGVLPGLHSMLVLQVIFDLLTGAYVALLIRLRNLAVERRRKLTYLPPPAADDPPRVAYARSTIRATPLEAWVTPASALR